MDSSNSDKVDDTGKESLKPAPTSKVSGSKHKLIDEDEERKAERRAANRRAAMNCRQRRKNLIADLQKTIEKLCKDRTELRNSNSELRAKLDLAMLENELLKKQHLSPSPGVAAPAVSHQVTHASPRTQSATAQVPSNPQLVAQTTTGSQLVAQATAGSRLVAQAAPGSQLLAPSVITAQPAIAPSNQIIGNLGAATAQNSGGGNILEAARSMIANPAGLNQLIQLSELGAINQSVQQQPQAITSSAAALQNTTLQPVANTQNHTEHMQQQLMYLLAGDQGKRMVSNVL